MGRRDEAHSVVDEFMSWCLCVPRQRSHSGQEGAVPAQVVVRALGSPGDKRQQISRCGRECSFLKLSRNGAHRPLWRA